MNKKEELIWRVIDNVISCCAVTRIDGAKSITREDGIAFNRWYADMCRKGIQVDWYNCR